MVNIQKKTEANMIGLKIKKNKYKADVMVTSTMCPGRNPTSASFEAKQPKEQQ